MSALLVFCVGLLFGTGLVVSGMIVPQKVIGFLDITGQWDPSLAFVMGAAVLTHFVGQRWVLRRDGPWLAGAFSLPSRRDIDLRLVAGSALFGLGWGWVGLCPGPALANLAIVPKSAGIFVAAMLGAMLVWRGIQAGFSRT